MGEEWGEFFEDFPEYAPDGFKGNSYKSSANNANLERESRNHLSSGGSYVIDKSGFRSLD